MPSFVTLKDLKITFKPHPITQDLQVSKDEAAVKQSVVNLLMTIPGERPFNNLLGSRLSELLFEPLDYGVAAQVENEIKDTIERFEPRVDIVDLDVQPSFDENAFSAHLEFRIRGRNDDTPLSINFLLQRTQ